MEELSRASGAVAEAVVDLPQSDVSTVLHMIALQAQSITPADYIALGIGDDPSRPFHPWVFVGMSQEDAHAVGRAPRPVGTLARVAREGEVIRSDDVRDHAAFRGFPPNHPELGPFLGVPLLHRGRPVGNLYLAQRPGAVGFTEHEERLMRMLATRVAPAIETASLYATASLQRAWLQSVIDQMPDGVLLYDEQGYLRATNQGIAALSCEETGDRDPFGNPRVIELRHADGAALPAEQLPIVRVLNRHEAIAREEMLVRRRTGELTPVAVSASPVRHANGDISGAMVIIQDITERKELERLREEWAAVVAHDLRQPVSIIGITAESLQRHEARDLPDRARRALERIRAASRRLSRMINDLLDASRIESKRLTLECRRGELNTFIESVTDELEELISSNRVNLVLGKEQVVWIDPDRIHQVLGNLISNAAKYGAAGTDIRVEAVPREGAVEIIVTNRGAGIPPDQLPHLFSRFSRIGDAGASQVPGLGLGLYIARGIIEAHHGRLWAESTPGEATRFHFTLPMARGGPPPPDAPPPPA